MSKNKDPVLDFVTALSDKRVKDKLSEILQENLQAAFDKIDELKKQTEKQGAEIAKLKSDLSVAYNKIDDLESYNRRDNLIITGLPSTSYAEASSGESATDNTAHMESEHARATEESVLALCQQLQVQITTSDISIAHRLKKRGNPNNRGPPAVIVRFTNRKARDAVYAARFLLRNRRDKIYINEDLTANVAKVFAEARQLVKQRIIYSAWTKAGAVFIKQDSSPSCRPTRILSADDLPRASRQ
jgi:ribosome biogenesis protein Nip4